jgi:hypothetical protein
MELMGFLGSPEASVEVIWCSCEHCCAAGPRYMVVTRHRHEVLLPLRTDCCWLADRCVSGLVTHEDERG